MFPKSLYIQKGKLAYPARQPLFDFSHVCAPGAQFAYASSGTGTFLKNILDGSAPALGTTAGTLFTDGTVGSGVDFSGSTSAGMNVQAGTTQTNSTQAAIFFAKTGTTGSPFYILSNTRASAGCQLQQSNSGTTCSFILNRFGASNDTLTSGLATGVHYFVVFSTNNTTTTGQTNWAYRCLENGKMAWGTVVPASAPSANYNGGRIGAFGAQAGLKVAAAYLSNSFFTMAQLRQWAEDPWSLWYADRTFAIHQEFMQRGALGGLPPGKQIFDTSQPDPNANRSIQLRSFDHPGGQLLLTAQDKFNPGQQLYDTPPAWLASSDPFSQWRTWQWQYRPILIGQDKLNPGKQSYDLPPAWVASADTFAQWRSWTGSYNLNLIGKDQLPTGQQLNYLPAGQVPDSFAQWRSWTGSYNLNLIGQDKLPTGARSYDLPASQVIDPFARWRSWTGSYNLNLIGQDRFPPGKQWNELPRGVTWLPDSPPQNLANTLLKPTVSAFPPGAQLWELSPRSQDYFAQWRSWTDSYNLNLIGQDQLPTGARLYDRQVDPQDGFAQWRSWAGWYNQNLIAQDQFPIGAQWDDAPPRGAVWQPDSPPPNLVNSLLSAPPTMPPGKQYSERPRFFFLM